MEPSDTPGGSAVGASSWPCSVASWDTPSRYAKSVVDWPPAKGSCDKGAVKLHLLLDHDGYLPAFAVITERRTRTTGWWRNALGQAKLGPIKHRGAEINHRGHPNSAEGS